MLKETIQYKDWDGNDATDVLYFNISQVELAENLHLRDEFEKIEKDLDMKPGLPTRDLRPEEIGRVLKLVKSLMELAYGVRVDANRFEKVDENGRPHWNRFVSTATYDAYITSLFREPERANNFILKIFPQELIEEGEKLAKERGLESISDISTIRRSDETQEVAGDTETTDPRPAYQIENREPTQKELTAMGREELLEAMRFKNQLNAAEPKK